MKKYGLIILGALLVVPTVWADDDDGYDRRTIAPVTNQLYLNECSSCHMAYPPALLPARSWQKLMGGLSSHFGDDATLQAETQQALTDFLAANAADRSNNRRSSKLMASIAPNETPLRISETPYIQRKHREIPPRYIQGNENVRSLANCSACHRDAARGDFNEHGVQIPGLGRWDD